MTIDASALPVPTNPEPASGHISTSQPDTGILRARWLLAGAIVLTFILGQVVGELAEGKYPAVELISYVIGDLIGGVAAWISLTWAYREKRRHATFIADALRNEQALNRRLQRTNQQLTILSEANAHIAGSLTVDDILDAALTFSQRLICVHAAALTLIDPTGPIDARLAGTKPDELTRLRTARRGATITRTSSGAQIHRFSGISVGSSLVATCIVVPLDDGVEAVGRTELYLPAGVDVADDDLALLGTINGEIAEAIVNARRRAREERGLYELERAITEERARIARDIHDGIAQTLAFQRMRIDLWKDWIDTDPGRLHAELDRFKQEVREQIRELRRAIFALRPVEFDVLGFLGGIHRYVSEFASQQGWVADVDFHEAPTKLTPEEEATCFRVIQEALTNSAKHANATRVAVTLRRREEGVQVFVSDDGIGFEPGEVRVQMGHLGLRQMTERLAALGGHLQLRSHHGAGTEVVAWIPSSRDRCPIGHR